MIDGRGNFCEIVLRWLSLDFTDDQSTLVQVMAWCCQAASHYLSQCWPRSLLPYGVTRPQWVKIGELADVMCTIYHIFLNMECIMTFVWAPCQMIWSICTCLNICTCLAIFQLDRPLPLKDVLSLGTTNLGCSGPGFAFKNWFLLLWCP